MIFVEDQLLQTDGHDSTSKEVSETTIIQVENNPVQETPISTEATPEHEVQEPVESESSEVRQLTRERRLPSWLSEYITESNVAYCILMEDGEPSTIQEATK